ncbi:MAG TPA: MobA/MobL family protein [Polyangiales bacterium]|nr:MobA/MobL family protein [Polyangiales bacterium]
MKTFSRSGGSGGKRATSAAAYRAGERIRDQRTGVTYDHRRRQDVLHREIVLPKALERAGSAASWARDRATLWNAAEHAETRRNSRVAREFMVALPHELKQGERVQLARGFARELVERYNNAIDLVMHAPRSDPRNFHAHLLATTREITSEGLSRKTTLELSGTQRHQRGLLRWSEERTYLRERWASLTNEALKAAHLEVRVSHEYPARDATRMPRLPSLAYHIERRGGHSVIAERLRERHYALLQQSAPGTGRTPQRLPWLQRARAAAQSTWLSLRQRLSPQPQPQPRPQLARSQAHAHTADAPPHSWQREPGSSSKDDIARQSFERWKAYRAQLAAHPELAQKQLEATHQSRQAERGMDIDLGL